MQSLWECVPLRKDDASDVERIMPKTRAREESRREEAACMTCRITNRTGVVFHALSEDYTVARLQVVLVIAWMFFFARVCMCVSVGAPFSL